MRLRISIPIVFAVALIIGMLDIRPLAQPPFLIYGSSSGSAQVIKATSNTLWVSLQSMASVLTQTVADVNNSSYYLWRLDLSSSGYGNFETVYQTPVFPDDLTRADRTLSYGYNVLRAKSTEPSFSWTVESYYAIGANRVVESYWQYVPIGGGGFLRPIATQVDRVANTNTNSYQANSHNFQDDTSAGQMYLDATGLNLQSSLPLVQLTNNVCAVRQENGAANNTVCAFKVNASNVLELGDSAGVLVSTSFSINSGLSGVVNATAGAVSASYSITGNALASQNNIDLTLTQTGTGTLDLVSGATAAGATVFLDSAGGRGTGIRFRKSGAFMGYVGGDGQYLGNTNANFAVIANTNLDFYVGFGGTASWRMQSSGGHLVAISDNTTDIGASGATRPRNLYLAGSVRQVGSTTTSGTFGTPAIVATGRVTAQSAANASISTFTVGSSDGSFDVSANLNATAVTVLSTTLSCSYTDESNTSRTLVLPVAQLSGSFIAGGAITGTGAWETPVMHIRAKAATVITIFTATGTFTGITYTAEGIIKQTS